MNKFFNIIQVCAKNLRPNAGKVNVFVYSETNLYFSKPRQLKAAAGNYARAAAAAEDKCGVEGTRNYCDRFSPFEQIAFPTHRLSLIVHFFY